MASNQPDNTQNQRTTRTQRQQQQQQQYNHYYNQQHIYHQQQQQQRYRYSNTRSYQNDQPQQQQQQQHVRHIENQQKKPLKSSRQSSISSTVSSSLQTCTCICCQHELRTYATYSCMHYVCLHCAIKMRILCEKLDCPICRQISDKILCTKDEIINRNTDELQFNIEINKNYTHKQPLNGGFYYDNDIIKVEYEQILGNFCKLCDTRPTFSTFTDLESHMKRIHKRFYCDLCLNDLKLFSFERKYYTREELAQHRREGDLNDNSFKGHPLCEFCDERFFDRDDLYRHFRKEHYYCHFCDADGNEEYHSNYEQLRGHFIKYHFLCELDECGHKDINSREYSVFRTELDYQAHRKQKHAKTKSESKSLSKLNIEFNLRNPIRERIRGGGSGSGGSGGGGGRRQNQDTYNEQQLQQSNLKSLYEEYNELHQPDVTHINLSDETQSTVTTSSATTTTTAAITTIIPSITTINPTNEPQLPQSTTWRDLISNGPAPRMHLDEEFPSLNMNGTLHSSLNSLGESISKQNSAWSAKIDKSKKKCTTRKTCT